MSQAFGLPFYFGTKVCSCNKIPFDVMSHYIYTDWNTYFPWCHWTSGFFPFLNFLPFLTKWDKTGENRTDISEKWNEMKITRGRKASTQTRHQIRNDINSQKKSVLDTNGICVHRIVSGSLPVPTKSTKHRMSIMQSGNCCLSHSEFSSQITNVPIKAHNVFYQDISDRIIRCRPDLHNF